MSSPGAPAGLAADRYWRAACALASAHLFGTTWPPPGAPQRTRLVGHWGCNPGIAWIVGHLAAHWREPEPLQLVVGSGHAGSFLFAHDALSHGLGPAEIGAATARYGAPDGDTSEPLGLPGLPYFGGELGPALGVSQALAAHLDGPPVACVIGDGECESPAALAALAHAEVLLASACGRGWLPVINANGARMGGPARFGVPALTAMLQGFGYRVVVSDADPATASAAAAEALRLVRAREPAAWVSATEKGWPAPREIQGGPYRGAPAHKAPLTVRDGGLDQAELARWFGLISVADLLDAGARIAGDVSETARRVTLTLPALPLPRVPRSPAVDAPDRVGWAPPVSGADSVLAARRIRVYSPDEASSNGLHACLAADVVTEVLAEELCAAWCWGTIEAGRPAAFVTYEAFAPLAGTLVAQYAKFTHARPPRHTPPLLVVATSLGWANAPTHQNTDLTGTLVARPLPRTELIHPVGATSAATRLDDLATRLRDGVGVLISSKQALLDLPDPGGPAVRYRLTVLDGAAADGAIVAVGDVCVTEAIAAAAMAAARGVTVEVVAVVEVKRLGGALRRYSRLPLIGVTVGAPRYTQALLWESAGRLFPVHGYEERFAPTAWETLRANGMDRVSLLCALAGCVTGATRAALTAACADLPATADRAAIPQFGCPPLQASPLTVEAPTANPVG